MLIGNNIKKLLIVKGYNIRSLCIEKSINYNWFWGIANNKRSAGMAVVKILKEAFPELNLNWLLYDEGEAFSPSIPHNTENSIGNEPVTK